jgi:hypothetical protein
MTQRTLVTYHYFEKDRTYVDNFLHFLRFGYSDRHDYLVIVAGSHSIELPERPNLRYIFTANKNSDFGGYAEAIKTAIDPEAYDFFFFINSSVRGPFTATHGHKDWTSYFLEHFTDDVGLVGATINILPASTIHSLMYEQTYAGRPPFSHVQTTTYVMPRATLAFLIENGFYRSDAALEKREVIRDYEIRLSQMIIGNGWNIKCLLPEYNRIDYRQPHGDVNPTSENGDALFRSAYFGRTLHPFDVIFLKINRGLFPPEHFDRLAYTAHVATGSAPAIESGDLRAYMTRLESVATEQKRFDVTQMTSEQVLTFTRRLLETYPQFAKDVEQILTDVRARK